MQRRTSGRWLAVMATACLLTGAATSGWAQGNYPRVYGPTGRPYGPTQAHYQYQRQYGRPWHGVGGVQNGGYSGNFYVPPVSNYQPYYGGFYAPGGYGFGVGGFYPGVGYSSYGYGYTGGYIGFLPPAPYITQPFTTNVGQDPFNNSVLQGTLEENAVAWGNAQPVGRGQPIIPRSFRASTPEQRIRSARLMGQGDQWFRKQNWPQAYARFKSAAAATPELADPRFRMGITLANMRQYDLAVAEMKRGLERDPRWAVTGQSLEELFGDENILAQNALIHETAEWVREDLRNPDRLFLLGVLLHFNGEQDRGRILFDTAARLGRSPSHVMAFLDPPEDPAQPDAAAIPPEVEAIVNAPSGAPPAVGLGAPPQPGPAPAAPAPANPAAQVGPQLPSP